MHSTVIVKEPPWRYRLARWLGHRHGWRRGRDRWVRLLGPPTPSRSIPFVSDFNGWRFHGDLNSFLDWSVYVYGAYSRYELLLLEALAKALQNLRAPLHVADVGANIGLHSLHLSRWVETVYAFEPHAPVRESAAAHLQRNAVRNVRLLPYGLGAEDGDVTFVPPATNNLGTGRFVGSAEHVGGLQLPLRRGDAALAELQAPRLGLIKLDVEGFEAEVFRGLQQRLQSDRPVVLMEISGADRSGFGSLREFQALCYPDHGLYAVEATSISGSFRLGAVQFGRVDELLIVPNELRPALAHLLPPQALAAVD
jgi:FkbM family methyltransferase